MKKKKQPIFRPSVALLALLVLFSAIVRPVVAKQEVKKPTTEQSKKAKSEKDEKPTVQVLSVDAVVVHAVSFDFGQEFYLLPPSTFLEPLNLQLPRQFDTFYYFFSFFKNVFGHHIAINAP